MAVVVEGLVSTIIPVYNRAVFLDEAVRSVLAQTYRLIEIILIDDGSTDDTSEQIARLQAEAPEVIRTVRIENRGPGGAREVGRQLARGEFIQYLDSDDRLLPGKFSRQVKALRKAPQCGIAYGVTRLIGERGEVLQEPYKYSGQRHRYLFPLLLVERWWNTHTPLYRRSVCEAIGPWTCERMGEDWQYDARAGALRTELVFCKEVVSEHRDHGQGRLTRGRLSSANARDLAVLIPRLYACAQQAGVEKTAPEMVHFVRWAFLVARQAGAFGHGALARECLEIALKATAPKLSRDVVWFGRLTRLLGWRLPSQVVGWVDALRERRRERCLS